MSDNNAFMEMVRTPLHEQLIGEDPKLLEVRELVERLAQVDLTVLITGETGTGKDIAARLLHRLSPRYRKPFIKVNCPSVPESILESELFGYERGAFTGAHTAKPGRFELASGGTIFLDEISETPHSVQTKLLQVLDGEPFLRIGGTEPIVCDTRVVAATNIKLEDGVARGSLREDVSYRLSEVVVRIPPLRERRGDIPLLAEHFNYNTTKMLHKEYTPLPSDALERLQRMDYPGNIRELAGRIKKYVATASTDSLFEEQERPIELSGSTPGNGSKHTDTQDDELVTPFEKKKFMPLREAARLAAEKAEKELIEETLRYTLWNRRKAAKLLQTSYSSLLRRITAYNIGK